MFCSAVTPGQIPVYVVHLAKKEILIHHFTCDAANLPLQVCSYKSSQVSSQTDSYEVN